jgi:hypothetical protein
VKKEANAKLPINLILVTHFYCLHDVEGVIFSATRGIISVVCGTIKVMRGTIDANDFAVK